MPSEASFESAAKIGPADTLQLVVKLDRQTARLDHGAQLPAYVHQVGIDISISATLTRSRNRLATQNLRGVAIKNEATAKPFRLAITQSQTVCHAGASEPLIPHQTHQVWFIDRIGADPKEASVQFLRDTTYYL